MNAKELNAFLDKEVEGEPFWTYFEEWIKDDGYSNKEIVEKYFSGHKIEFIEGERTSGEFGEYDEYHWVFKVDDDFFMVEGNYSSWDSPWFDYNIVYGAKLETRTIEEWVRE